MNALPRTPEYVANYEELSPLLFLAQAKAGRGHQLAVVDQGVTFTYSELAQEVAEVGAGLQLQPGYRVATLCRNHWQMIVASFAVAHAGGVIVPLNIRLHSEEIAEILTRVKCQALWVDDGLWSAKYESLVKDVVRTGRSNFDSWGKSYDDLRDSGRQSGIKYFYKAPRSEFDTLSINFTSGTSGRPQGVEISHRSAYLNALGECVQASLEGQSRYLWVLPLYHCNGWCFVWAVVAANGTQYCLEKPSPQNILSAVFDHNISHFCAAPIVVQSLVDHFEFTQLQIRATAITILTAGSAPSAALFKRCASANVKLVHVYGLTESLGPHLVNIGPVDHGAHHETWRAHHQGNAGPHAHFARVVDTAMADVPWDGNTQGEIVIRGNNVMKGYLNDAAATARAFHGGWFHTGDAAVIHDDGSIQVTDRIKDIINSGGEKVASLEIEKVILEHPSVKDVAVVAIPDEKWGEVPLAIVEPRKEKSLSKEELRIFCRTKMASFKVPKEVIFQTLSRSSTGKINKALLREQLL